MTRLTRVLLLVVSAFAVREPIHTVAGSPAAAHDVSLSRLYPPDQVARLLVPPEAWHPLPRLADRQAWQGLPEDLRARIVASAEKAAERPMAVLPASVYLDFGRNGNRSRYEGIVNARRSRLHSLVLGECVEAKGRFLDPIADTLWATFEESSWCIPAHIGAQKAGVGLPDENEPIVDLFAAQTANSIVWTDYLLGEKLEQVSPLLRGRLAREVRRRILEPYRNREDFGWMGLSNASQRSRPNNWNPWINSNVLAATLVLEREPAARAALVSKVLRSLDAYLVPYPADGSCDEGPGYWGVAGASLYDNLELLFSASNGRISVFDRPVIAEIGRFIVRAHIAGDYFVDIGDNAARLQPDRGLIFRFGRRVGDRSMQAFAAGGPASDADLNTRSLERALRDLFGWKEMHDQRSAAAPLLRDVWLPSEDMQLMAARDRAGSETGLYLAAWGGHNGQSHNHNDVGNVLVFLDGRPVLVDAGRPAYTRQTFSSRRYEIWAMQSAYHNVPTVKGVQQSDGRKFAARDVTYASNDAGAELRMDIAPAYPAAAALASWVRRARLERGKQITIEESVAFAGEPGEIVLNFMTPGEVDLGIPGRILFRPTGTAQRAAMEYDPAKFTASVERIALDDAGLERVWEGRLQRVQLRMAHPSAKPDWILRISSLAR
jgi:hypothetical protein